MIIPLLNIYDDKRKVKQLLILAEMAVRNLSGITSNPFYNHFYKKTGNDLDHIVAKGSREAESMNPIIAQRVGNACILDTSANRSQKAASFGSEIKQKALKNSENWVTKAVVLEAKDLTGPKNKKAVEYLSCIEEVSERAIEKREKELIEP